MKINLNWQRNLSMKIYLTEILFFLFGIALIYEKWLITNINAPVTYVQTNNRGIYVYMRIRSFISGMSFEPREVPNLHTSGAANATLIEISGERWLRFTRRILILNFLLLTFRKLLIKIVIVTSNFYINYKIYFYISFIYIYFFFSDNITYKCYYY